MNYCVVFIFNPCDIFAPLTDQLLYDENYYIIHRLISRLSKFLGTKCCRHSEQKQYGAATKLRDILKISVPWGVCVGKENGQF